VLRELGKVEQHYDGVLAVHQRCLTISEVAIAYGVSRPSIYRLMRLRYEKRCS
jgi:predicted DNA-binding transcriptional regulator AlpA